MLTIPLDKPKRALGVGKSGAYLVAIPIVTVCTFMANRFGHSPIGTEGAAPEVAVEE